MIPTLTIEQATFACLRRVNPALQPIARDMAQARAKLFCAGLTYSAGARKCAAARLAEHSYVISVPPFRRQPETIAPIGSGRKHAKDHGGRIVTAMLRVANFILDPQPEQAKLWAVVNFKTVEAALAVKDVQYAAHRAWREELSKDDSQPVDPMTTGWGDIPDEWASWCRLADEAIHLEWIIDNPPADNPPA